MLERHASVKLRSRQLKYTRLQKLNKFATFLTLALVLAMASSAAAYLINTWYVIDDDGTEFFYGPLYVCTSSQAVCSLWDPSVDFTVTKSDGNPCTVESADMQVRIYVQWVLSAIHALSVLVCLMLVCVVNCRPTRAGVSMAMCVLLVLGTLSAGVNAIIFPFTLNAFLFCGDEYCSVVPSSGVCSNGVSWGFYVYCGSIFFTIASAAVAIAMRLVLFNADTKARIEDEVASSFRREPTYGNEHNHNEQPTGDVSSAASQHHRRQHASNRNPVQQQQPVETSSSQNQFGDLRMEQSRYVDNGYDDDDDHDHRRAGNHALRQEGTNSSSSFSSGKVAAGKLIGGADDWIHDPRQPTYLYSKALNCFYDEDSQMYYEVNAGTWLSAPPVRR